MDEVELETMLILDYIGHRIYPYTARWGVKKNTEQKSLMN